MNTFLRFFYEFISIFFEGIIKLVQGFVNGLTMMFNIFDYKKILESYKDSFSTGEWILVILTIIFLVVIVLGFILLVIEELLDEIGNLNKKVRQLMKEKDELMAMKVSQLGLKPDEGGEEASEGGNPEGNPEEEKNDENAGNVRFPKLVRIDERMKGFKAKNYNDNFTLEELIDNFRCFAATQLHLYFLWWSCL